MYINSPKKRRRTYNTYKLSKRNKKNTPRISRAVRIQRNKISRENKKQDEERSRNVQPVIDHNGNIVLLHPNDPPPPLRLVRQ